MGLFTKKPKVVSIQINDDKINREICKLISVLKKNITQFMNILEGRYIGDKNEKLDEIIKLFAKMADDIKSLINDVQKIQNIELQRKDYIKFNDEQFLKDKLQQLFKISDVLDRLIEMLQQNPTDKEFKEDLLKEMIMDVNVVIESINKILEDDKELDAVYKTLEKI